MPHSIEMPNDVFLQEIRHLLEEGHTATLRVRGNSMRPFLEDRRDSIVLTAVTHVCVGDAVLAETEPGHYVFHRIISIDGDKVTLMGDGNVGGTEHCLRENVVANAHSFIRKGKTYSPEGSTWRRYSWWWTRLLPLRRYLLWIYRHFFI
ncbi:MAG: S24/S26 family peptidase [Bacteroidaceae bacterium]|nr:S24/S26 family peptidase [Bacteroidaceae bacterium]